MSQDKKSAAMNILNKIVEAIREDSKKLTEAVMDSAGNQHFEKKIDIAKINLKHAKSSITNELSKELRCSRKVKFLKEQVEEQEQLIIKALSQEDEEQALKLATDMVDLEQDRDAEMMILNSHELHLDHLTKQMENAERNLKELERQLAMVKTTENIQKATDVITKNFENADNKMLSAKRSLDRIRKKQDIKNKQLELKHDFNAIENKGGDKKIDSKPQASDILKRYLDKD